jgi:hypothetical protein
MSRAACQSTDSITSSTRVVIGNGRPESLLLVVARIAPLKYRALDIAGVARRSLELQRMVCVGFTQTARPRISVLELLALKPTVHALAENHRCHGEARIPAANPWPPSYTLPGLKVTVKRLKTVVRVNNESNPGERRPLRKPTGGKFRDNLPVISVQSCNVFRQHRGSGWDGALGR